MSYLLPATLFYKSKSLTEQSLVVQLNWLASKCSDSLSHLHLASTGNIVAHCHAAYCPVSAKVYYRIQVSALESEPVTVGEYMCTEFAVDESSGAVAGKTAARRHGKCDVAAGGLVEGYTVDVNFGFASGRMATAFITQVESSIRGAS